MRIWRTVDAMVTAGARGQYTPKQVKMLERAYSECPSLAGKQQHIRDCPILSSIKPKQIKVWSLLDL